MLKTVTTGFIAGCLAIICLILLAGATNVVQPNRYQLVPLNQLYFAIMDDHAGFAKIYELSGLKSRLVFEADFKGLSLAEEKQQQKQQDEKMLEESRERLRELRKKYSEDPKGLSLEEREERIDLERKELIKEMTFKKKEQEREKRVQEWEKRLEELMKKSEEPKGLSFEELRELREMERSLADMLFDEYDLNPLK